MPLYFEDTEKLLLPLRNTMEALGRNGKMGYGNEANGDFLPRQNAARGVPGNGMPF